MMREIMRNWGSFFMRVASGGHVRFQKNKKNCSCANDANIKSMPMFDGTNYLVRENL